MSPTSSALFILINTLLLIKIQASKEFCYRDYENYPAPPSYVKENCRKYVLPDNMDSFKDFIPISSLEHNYAIKGQTLNIVLCFKGLHSPEIITTEKPSHPVNGDKFTWTVLNSGRNSRIYHTETTNYCDTITSPNAFSPYETYCMNFILHDDFDGSGLGRAALWINSIYPGSLSCYDVPAGHIKATKYISFSTYTELGAGSESVIYYDCEKIQVETKPPAKPLTKPTESVSNVIVEVRQNQIAVVGR